MSTDIVDSSGTAARGTRTVRGAGPEGEAGPTLRADTLNLFDSTAVAVSSVAPAYSLASTLALHLPHRRHRLRRPGGHAGGLRAGPLHRRRLLPPQPPGSRLPVPPTPGCPSWSSPYGRLVQRLDPGGHLGHLLRGRPRSWPASTRCSCSTRWGGSPTRRPTTSGTRRSRPSLFLALVTFICIYGIRWTTNFQWVLVIIEYVAVLVFSIGGIIKVAVDPPDGLDQLPRRVVLARQHPRLRGPGRRRRPGRVLLLGLGHRGQPERGVQGRQPRSRARPPSSRCSCCSSCSSSTSSPSRCSSRPTRSPTRAATILFYFGEQFAGGWAKYVMIFAVHHLDHRHHPDDAAAGGPDQLSPCRATGCSRSSSGPSSPKFKTPATGTLILAFIALIGMYGIVTFDSAANVTNILGYLITDIGVLVAIYYGATGLACAWAFRKVAFQKTSFFFTGILLPALGRALHVLGRLRGHHASNWNSHMAADHHRPRPRASRW